jgi:hypothetical protein
VRHSRLAYYRIFPHASVKGKPGSEGFAAHQTIITAILFGCRMGALKKERWRAEDAIQKPEI